MDNRSDGTTSSSPFPVGGPRSVVAGKNGRDEARPSSGERKSGRDEARPSRKTPAHHPVVEAFNRTTIVFVTVCSQDRRPLFDKPDIHELMKVAWMMADDWSVGRYVIMPDHIHFFCAPSSGSHQSLAKWVQYWKSVVSNRWPRAFEHPIWQKSFWDTQLRRGEKYSEKWEYVRRNPVRAGLCSSPEEWPFQGELSVLMWHD